ncbi:response regulator transcription factor [Macrococcus armenti]|uniref:response regulator transcription factor n=1 Tax=Macrococcus armenti TaxID=2875764 RepID=UPI001CCE9C77|nr:response regulator transcription factor [Macrococcus armenti]UBH22457.1 response regulator transcription factor [Macrococcus armenti]
MQNNILVVDDEAAIRREVKEGFLRHGFQVYDASNGDEAIELLDNESVDLCIVDIMMPGIDGFKLCEQIKQDYALPVIMLTARDALGDKRIAFQAGSDDYVTKPFEIEEVIFRAQAILKRYEKSVEKVKFGKLTIDAESYEVTMEDEALYIPRKEFELLYYLVRHYPKVATREQLIEEIWGFDFDGDERTVDVHVKRIRKRLGAFDSGVEIQTVRGVGYKVHHV